MSEKVVCHACGKKYKWNEQYAGRKIKCSCGATFRMVRAAPVAPTESLLSDPKPDQQEPALTDLIDLESSVQKTPPPLPSRSTDDGLLEVAGSPPPLPSADTPSHCPKCSAPLARGAVICVSCGFNLKTGTSIRTSKAATQEELAERDQEDLLRAHRFQEWIAPTILLVAGVLLFFLAAHLQVQAMQAELAAFEAEFAEQSVAEEPTEPVEALVVERNVTDEEIDAVVVDLAEIVENESWTDEQWDAFYTEQEAVWSQSDWEYYEREFDRVVYGYDADAEYDLSAMDDTMLTAVSFGVLILGMAATTFVGTLVMLMGCVICVMFFGVAFGNLFSALYKLPAIFVFTESLFQVIEAVTGGVVYGGMFGWGILNYVLFSWLFDLDTDETWYVLIGIFFAKLIMVFFLGGLLMMFFT